MIIKECLREAVDSDTQHSDQDISEKSLDVHEGDLPYDNKTDKSTDVLNAEKFGDEAINLNKRMNKICRICLEEGVLSSVFTKNFNTSVNEMIEYCCNIKIYKDDGLPELVCSNCIYKLGVAYHFKKTCESANIKLRQYLGVELPNKTKDAAIMTDPVQPQTIIKRCKCKLSSRKSSSTYKRKPESEKQKRGPKPKQKEIHSCYECDKQFRCQAQLEMHVRTHTGDKPFVCMYCPRRFTQKHNLTIHLRIHTGEKPFQCDVCSKRFSAQGNLNAHLKIHTGQRDHVCTLCNKPFITSSELTRHMNKHRGVKNFKCDLCEASYVHLRDLKLHKLKKHQMTINSQSKVNSDNHNNRNIIDVIGLDVEKDAQMAGNSSSHMMPQIIQKPVQQPITEQSQPIIYKDTKDIFPQYSSDSMLNNHSCTICGEGFDYITALAQHYLHSHKDFDYTQSKGYNLVS
ncbi:hypothetical protein K1T71_008854 [Dendrolimus kikuchii]|uniref:Uncharacterized protein n=1 Tax=Dendrolimus kikuchii TaxID=765133 RepID=A0ACC1CVM1_9NEOP|nr:hypothetical protein K1T71_008854 [Dendrolimus kikuchii]